MVTRSVTGIRLPLNDWFISSRSLRTCRQLSQRNAAIERTAVTPPSWRRSVNRRMASCHRGGTAWCKDPSDMGRWALASGPGISRRRERIVRRDRQRGRSVCLHFAWKSAKGGKGAASQLRGPLRPFALFQANCPCRQRLRRQTRGAARRNPTSFCPGPWPIRPGKIRKIAPRNDPAVRSGFAADADGDLAVGGLYRTVPLFRHGPLVQP